MGSSVINSSSEENRNFVPITFHEQGLNMDILKSSENRKGEFFWYDEVCRMINLSKNKITKVDLRCPNLTILILNSNLLENLEGHFPNLIRLEVSDNQLKTLQFKAENLTYLDASGNLLTEFPKQSYPRLSYCDISKNQIRNFEVEAPRLKLCNVSSNRLEVCVGNFPRLYWLNVSNNEIVAFDVKASALSGLTLKKAGRIYIYHLKMIGADNLLHLELDDTPVDHVKFQEEIQTIFPKLAN